MLFVIDFNGEENVGTFYQKELQKKKTRKGNKLYVKWKGYDNSFNSGLIKKS